MGLVGLGGVCVISGSFGFWSFEFLGS